MSDTPEEINTKNLIKFFKDNMANVSVVSKPDGGLVRVITPLASIKLSKYDLITSTQYKLRFNNEASTGEFDLKKAYKRITKLYSEYKQLVSEPETDALVLFLESL